MIDPLSKDVLGESLKALIRNLPEYPKLGVIFRDITTLLGDAEGFNKAVDALAAPFIDRGIDKVAAIEARGFIIGGAIAYRLGAGFVPVRKKGKLPWKTVRVSYDLEYGTDEMEIHIDAIAPNERVLLIDDLIATGGTAIAAVELIRGMGAAVSEACFIVDLPELGGAERLTGMGLDVLSLVSFPGH